ncbi:hypothetical protein AAB986_38140, partial [Burkholderia contaminans]
MKTLLKTLTVAALAAAV